MVCGERHVIARRVHGFLGAAKLFPDESIRNDLRSHHAGDESDSSEALGHSGVFFR
jgi:hypothetical protein